PDHQGLRGRRTDDSDRAPVRRVLRPGPLRSEGGIVEMATVTPVAINTMRQSTLGTADTCLHRLQYLFDPNVPRKGSVIRSIGTGYHAGIAEYYFRRRQGTLWDGIHPSLQEQAEFLLAAEAAFDEDVSEHELFDWRYQPRTYRQEEK